MAQLLPPIPKEPISPDSHIWRDWFNGLRNVLIGSIQGVVSWASINFTGSDIKDIVARSHQDLQNLQGGTAGQYYHLTAAQFTSVGTVTSVSVVSANGFAGTVATATTTPAITVKTSITGLLKGNGTAISAATASTDYLIPPSGTSILKAASGGALANAVSGTDYLAPFSSQTATYVYAAPSGAAGLPTFRALVAIDIPALSYVPYTGATGAVNLNAKNLTNVNTFSAATVKATTAAGYISSDGSTGYTGTITTSTLVGKTITIKDGIITGFA